MLPKSEPTNTKHRTSESTDVLLYNVQKEAAERLEVPVARLRMNWVLAGLAILGSKHPDELAEILRGEQN